MAASNWKRFNRFDKCPVCNGARKKNDCRQNLENELIHCRAGIENPNFINRGVDGLGFEMWASVDSANAFKAHSREEWLEKQRRREEAEKERIASIQSIASRDRDIKSILHQLDLSDVDRQLLRDRGFTDQMIDDRGFRSVERYQALAGHLRYGVDKYGNLINPVSGIICPVIDIYGNYVALRLYNPDKTKDYPKYTWLKDNAKLPNDETPLMLFGAEYGGTVVGIVEGLEFKPAIAAHRLGIPIIGAGGTNWASSPEQLREMLERLGAKQVRLFPDAGSPKNSIVLASQKRTIKLVQSFGYSVDVAWWGQNEKKDGDIDEINIGITRFQFLSPDDYFALKEESAFDRLKKFWSGLWVGKNKPKMFEMNGAIASSLPTEKDYQGEIIEFEAGQAPRLYEEIGRKGFKYTLDCSPTGSGKTWTVGELSPSAFFLLPDDSLDQSRFSQIIYCSPSPRNPNAAKVEADFYEIKSRNSGYELDYNKLTPNGFPYRTKITDDDLAQEFRTAGNCHKTNQFLDAYAKGHSTDGFCKSCPFMDECRKGHGNGYGYLSTAGEFKHETKVRAHLKGLPQESVGEDTILIIDEAETAEWTLSRQITLADINYGFNHLKSLDRLFYLELLPFKDSLLNLFDEVNNPSPNYGWIQSQVLPQLDIPAGIENRLEELRLIEEQSRPSPDAIENGAAMHNLFLHDLLAIAIQKKHGSISASNNAITITMRNERMIDTIKSGYTIIFQDATLSRQQLSLYLGVNESEILVIRQKSTISNNLTIKQYIGVGRLSNNRSDDEKRRVKMIRDYEKSLDHSVGFIEHKKYASGEDLIHGGDGRGSNLFQNKKTVVSLGTYRHNLLAVLNEYQSLTGKTVEMNNPDFVAFNNNRIAANVFQELGRLRANRRESEELTFKVYCDIDLSFLSEMGCKLEVIDTVTINSDFCEITTRTNSRNLQKGIEFRDIYGSETFNSCSQNDIAAFIGVSASAISQWLKRLGKTFDQYKEMVIAACNPKPKTDEELGEQKAVLVNYCVDRIKELLHPLSSISNTDFNKMIELSGFTMSWDIFIEAISRLPFNYSARFIFRMAKAIASGEVNNEDAELERDLELARQGLL